MGDKVLVDTTHRVRSMIDALETFYVITPEERTVITEKILQPVAVMSYLVRRRDEFGTSEEGRKTMLGLYRRCRELVDGISQLVSMAYGFISKDPLMKVLEMKIDSDIVELAKKSTAEMEEERKKNPVDVLLDQIFGKGAGVSTSGGPMQPHDCEHCMGRTVCALPEAILYRGQHGIPEPDDYPAGASSPFPRGPLPT